AEKQGWTFKKDRSLKGEVAGGNVEEGKLFLLLPTTYMNLSGEAVRKVLNFFKLDLSGLLIVADDISLDFGELRYRVKGSAGGHNGLKSIEAHLGTQEYERLRVGIGDRLSGLLEDHVLSPFTGEEKNQLPEVIKKGVQFLEEWLKKK